MLVLLIAFLIVIMLGKDALVQTISGLFAKVQLDSAKAPDHTK
jgi:hypothetical protein